MGIMSRVVWEPMPDTLNNIKIKDQTLTAESIGYDKLIAQKQR